MINIKETEKETTSQINTDNNQPTEKTIFETLSPSSASAEDKKRDINLVLDIPVDMTVELGRAKLTIKELLNLTQGAIIPLAGVAGEPLDILINGYLVASGEVVVVGDNYGVRITDIITPSERMRRLGR